MVATLSAVKKSNVGIVKTEVSVDAKIKKLTAAIEAQSKSIKEEVAKRKALELKLAELETVLDTESKVISYNLHREYVGELSRLRDKSQTVVDELTVIINITAVAESLQCAVLHKKNANPRYNYCMLKFDSKSADGVLAPPAGLGWELNKHKGSMGQETLDGAHYVHWMRLKNQKK